MSKTSIVNSALTLGVVTRIALVVMVVPLIQLELFEPFLRNFLANPSLDPWSSWLDVGGRTDAFPYGPLMVAYFGAFAAIGNVLPTAHGIQLGIALGILVADLVCWVLIWRSKPLHVHAALVAFVLSPLLLFAAYVHGQLDLLPAMFLAAAAMFLRKERWTLAGLVVGLSVSAKFSSLLVVALFAVFFLRNGRFRSKLAGFTLALVPGLIVAFLPALTPGYRQMVLATPQVESLVAYGIELGPGFTLLVAPILIVAWGFTLWSFRRANPHLLFLFISMLLATIPLLSPSSPGWFLWAAPLLAIVAADGRLRQVALVFAFWCLQAIATSMNHSWGFLRGTAVPTNGVLVSGLQELLPEWALAVSQTFAVAAGALMMWILFSSLAKIYDSYRLSSQPLTVALAGDSGTGKDTLCASLSEVFGGSRTTFIMGDDYHYYERGAAMWRAKTHLDPVANRMARLTNDTRKVVSGRPIWSRHYDHDRGRFTRPRQIGAGDLVVVSGLHSLTSSYIRSSSDLSVFLDMSEELRTVFKVERDMRERGHDPNLTLASINRRAKDRLRYIQPQIRLADLVLRLEPAEPLSNDFTTIPKIPMLNVKATLRESNLGEDIARAFTSLAGAQTAVEYLEHPGSVDVTISGTDWISSGDVAAVATHLITSPQELFVREPEWLSGSKGVCQLILVLALLERRRMRMESL